MDKLRVKQIKHMKITKSQLKEIIREEIQSLNESTNNIDEGPGIFDQVKGFTRMMLLLPQMAKLAKAVENEDLDTVKNGVSIILDKMGFSGEKREQTKKEIYQGLANTSKNKKMAVILNKMASEMM